VPSARSSNPNSDIGGENLRVKNVERRFRGVIGMSLLSGGEDLTPEAGTSCKLLGGVRHRQIVGREHDGLETVEGREGAGPCLLGEQERCAPAGVPDAHCALETESVDSGQDVSPKTDPVEVQVWCHLGPAVPAEVERQAVES